MSGEEDDDEIAWTLQEDGAVVGVWAIMDLWKEWKAGHYPKAGGWLDQPLALIVQIKAIDLVYETYRFKTMKDADWSKLSLTQAEIIRWLDGRTDKS